MVNNLKVMGMYPPEWWWAERQVSEVLAENPGELVKTGTFKIFRQFLTSETPCCMKIPNFIFCFFRFAECSLYSSSKPLEVEQDASFSFQSDCVE